MATVSVVPDKFESGDFLGWLHHFDCCATANGWSADDKLKKLPAFLCGPAASYYFTLSDDNKQSYADLTKNLTVLLCPKLARENYFADFERRFLRQAEDPSLYLWDLQNLLGKADPDMAASARTALLTRQFMKGLPPDLRLRLLENNPTPDLKEVTTFVQRHRALYGTSQTDSVCSAADADVGAASHVSLRHSVKELTVAALTVNQSKLQSSVRRTKDTNNNSIHRQMASLFDDQHFLDVSAVVNWVTSLVNAPGMPSVHVVAIAGILKKSVPVGITCKTKLLPVGPGVTLIRKLIMLLL